MDVARTILERLAIGIAHREARDRHRLFLKSIRLMSFTFVPLVAHTKIERKAKETNKNNLVVIWPEYIIAEIRNTQRRL
jgi:hypothetical protein